MKLFYLSACRIPSEKANTYQVLQMCDALVGEGVELTLLHPHRVNTPAMRQVGDIQQYYQLGHRFPITPLPTIDMLWTAGRILRHTPIIRRLALTKVFDILMASYTRSLLRYLDHNTADAYYARDSRIARRLARSRPDLASRTFYEAHRFPRSPEKARKEAELLGKIRGLVTITGQLKERYLEWGVPSDRILVAPDGVDLRRFTGTPGKRDSRISLGLPADGKLVCYTGHLYPWKGVETLIRSSRHLPDDVHIRVVGGRPEDLARVEAVIRRENLPRVQLVGYVPPAQVPLHAAAADILVLPTSGHRDIGRLYTSPLKLFEYMAAERPVVASDLPSTREILRHGHNAHLVPPDDPNALAAGIRWLRAHPAASVRLAQQARADVDQYAWARRAECIAGFVRRRLTEAGADD